MVARSVKPFMIDGIDYTKEGIENVRQTLIVVRNHAMKDGDFEGVSFASHVIALLAYLIEVKEYASL
jgi:hypothetical protein